MKYIDLHCDTLTACRDRGLDLGGCNLQTDLRKLNQSQCAAQCFAIFTQGADAALRFSDYLAFYKDSAVNPILNKADLENCLNGGGTGSILTVESLPFLNTSALYDIAEAGVKMASLVWNDENSFAYPNLIFKGGMPEFERRERRGLKPLGRQAVEILDSLKIIVDISHLSDGGAEEILEHRRIPIVASHSNAAAVCNVSRNLTDGLIKKIADCGGVIGVNFCKDFLGAGNTFELVLAHINHIIKVGGEDCVAFGSDFDGIPQVPMLEDCTKMPTLINYLEGKIKCERLEKLCYKNFMRVFGEVCG